MGGVYCGRMDGNRVCVEDLLRTLGPAGSLWCPVHGHVLDVLAPPPLAGVVIICTR